MSDIKATVKENLIRLRRESGLTQLELAGKVNYSDKAVSRWETGEVTPDVETLAALASLYDVPIETFFHTQKEQEEAKKSTVRPSSITRIRAILALAICVVWATVLTLFFIFAPFYAHAWCILLWGLPASMLRLSSQYRTP